MTTMLNNLHFKANALLVREEGQDLVEYALVVALLALAATAGLNGLASAINTGFNNIAGILGSSIT